jgi:hypothetical protein
VNTVSFADNSKSTSNMLAAFWGQFNKKA